jgi:hypothetical protein
MFKPSRGTGMTISLVLGSLVSSSRAEANYVAGGQQTISTYFTQVSASFTVPPAPTQQSMAVTNLFPGLEDESLDTILQPVLEYGQQGPGFGWQMINVVDDQSGNPNNTVCNANVGVYCDEFRPVSPGDSIYATVAIDQGLPGANCNKVTGAKCNYNVMWFDMTTGAYSVLQDWLQASPLKIALGMAFEANESSEGGEHVPPTSCGDYPLAILTADVGLDTASASGSNLSVPVTTNLTPFSPRLGGVSNPPGCNSFDAAANGQTLFVLLGYMF